MAKSSLVVRTIEGETLAMVQSLTAADVAAELARLSEAAAGRPITFGGRTFSHVDVIALDDVAGDQRR